MKRNSLIQTVFLLLLLVLALGTEASYAESFTSAEDAAAYVRGQMKERAEEISVTLDCPLAEDPYGGDAEAAFQDLWERALAHTGVPDEGDYIYKALESWSRQTCEDAVDAGMRYTVRIWPVFRTTKAQEAAVTAAIDSAFASMTFQDKDDYGKIRVIHDWICDSVVYEYTRDVDPHTAYAAACNGAAVCQGYATLAYRMLLQAGFDARVISGVAAGGRHAWNIVKIGDVYYDLDVTWDDGDPVNYDYFLRTEEAFSDHVRSEEFDSEEFRARYRMSLTDFTPGESDAPGVRPWTLDEAGDLHINSQAFLLSVNDFAFRPWKDYVPAIRSISFSEKIRYIPDDAFRALRQARKGDTWF